MRGIKIIVTGRVQGVFFRASTRDEARNLGLKGWVRNLPNGDVEIAAEGNSEKLELFKAWCQKGPRMAIVNNIEMEESSIQNYEDFQVRY